MGSPTTFATRKSELLTIDQDATDDDVVDSYINWCDPSRDDCYMLKYCKLGVIMHHSPKFQTLFVHAGVRENCLGNVPGGGGPNTKKKLKTWVKEINAWKDSCLQDFVDNPLTKWSGGKTPRNSVSALLDYGVPGGNGGGTVV